MLIINQLKNYIQMKRKILITTATLLILAGGFSSCNKTKLSDINGVWIYSSEPNVTITLTIDSERVYVKTSFQDIDPYAEFYQFRNDDRYIIRGDTIFKDLNHSDLAFAITKVESNCLKLTYLGILPAMPLYIRDYFFTTKLNKL